MRLEYGVEVNLARVMTLNRGEVQLVGIVADPAYTTEAFLKSLAPSKPLLTVASEMPYLALYWMQRKLAAVGLGAEYAATRCSTRRRPRSRRASWCTSRGARPSRR